MSEDYQKLVKERLNRPMSFYPFLSIEFRPDKRFFTVMENRNSNMLGNFTGGDMAYIANAAAISQCASQGLFVQAASINVECLAKADGEVLLASNTVIHQGKKMIRTRSDVFVRNNGVEVLVAIAQINVSLMSDQITAKKIVHGKMAEPV